MRQLKGASAIQSALPASFIASTDGTVLYPIPKATPARWYGPRRPPKVKFEAKPRHYKLPIPTSGPAPLLFDLIR